MLGAWILVAPAAVAVSERVAKEPVLAQVPVLAEVPVPGDLPAWVDPVVQAEVLLQGVPRQLFSRQSFSAAMASNTT
jgi:hypothetical protein